MLMDARIIGYWVVTAYVAYAMFFSGLVELRRSIAILRYEEAFECC
jgi:hypothetical protein